MINQMTTADYMELGKSVEFTPLRINNVVIIQWQGLICKARLISISNDGEFATFHINTAGNMYIEHTYSRTAIGARFAMGSPVLLEVRNGTRWLPIEYSAIIQ